MRGHNTGVGLYSLGGFITAWFGSQHSHSPVSLLLPERVHPSRFTNNPEC
jgi:hypothetical protein